MYAFGIVLYKNIPFAKANIWSEDVPFSGEKKPADLGDVSSCSDREEGGMCVKKRLILGGFLLLGVAVYALLPQMVQSTITPAYYITPNLKTYENIIHCTGTIQAQEVKQITLSSPIVAEEVCISVGDIVQEGDVLVKVDTEKTEKLARSLDTLRDLAGDTTTDAQMIDWSLLASRYGLQTVQHDGSALPMDMQALEGFLNDAGLLENTEAADAVSSADAAEIVAPITGVVTALSIQPGVAEAAGKAVITIADNQHYKVAVSVREEDVARVSVGNAAKVSGAGFSGATYHGVVSNVHPTARKMLSGTATETIVDAEITLEHPDSRLKHGFTAKAEIYGGEKSHLITVPYEAIKQDADNHEYVYVYENGTLRKQIVEVGQELINEVEVISGVDADSIVIYNPSDLLQEGQMIHIKGRANVVGYDET